jgi:hypothetical protein
MCLSDKVKILDVLKDSMSLAEVGWHWRNESSAHSTAVNSVHPEYTRVFLSGRLLGSIDLSIPRLSSMMKCLIRCSKITGAQGRAK